MQPPVKNSVALGFDPGYRTGCKVAVVDATGKVLDTSVVYPTPPKSDIAGAERIIKNLIEKHKVDIIAIGNGTASHESEVFMADLLKKIDRKVSYMYPRQAQAYTRQASWRLRNSPNMMFHCVVPYLSQDGFRIRLQSLLR